MEATCFVTSKSFSKTKDLVPSLKARSPSHKKRITHCLHVISPCSSHAAICCNLGSSFPDDGREQSIESDWRSFRARLVAGEQSLRLSPVAPHSPPLGDRWAHPLHKPERGCLLVATKKLDGVHIFERTVVLLLSTGPMGPAGIIVNRPSLMSIKETRSTDLDVAGTFSDRPLFFGGPLEEGLFLVGPQGGNDGVGSSGVFEEVMKGLYYGTKESVGCAVEMVKRGVVGVGDFRFFDGYCQWEKEQLKEEIRAGYWSVVACSQSVIGLASAGSVGLWETLNSLTSHHKQGEQAGF